MASTGSTLQQVCTYPLPAPFINKNIVFKINFHQKLNYNRFLI